MDPVLMQTLMSEMPEMKQFAKYVAEEAMLLDSLDGLDKIASAEERGIEATARIRAKAILQKILGTLVHSDPLKGSNLSEEYAVDLK